MQVIFRGVGCSGTLVGLICDGCMWVRWIVESRAHSFCTTCISDRQKRMIAVSRTGIDAEKPAQSTCSSVVAGTELLQKQLFHFAHRLARPKYHSQTPPSPGPVPSKAQTIQETPHFFVTLVICIVTVTDPFQIQSSPVRSGKAPPARKRKPIPYTKAGVRACPWSCYEQVIVILFVLQ